VGILPLQGGRILIHGLPLGDHKDCVAYVPQREEVAWHFPVTVFDVVMMGRCGAQGWFRRPSKADHEMVQRSLAEMGIVDLAKNSISDLSGGQQQRVFLARAIAQNPHILLMDEPFTGVDVTTREATLRLLDHLREREVTTIISTHDLNLAASYFDRVLLLNKGLIAYGEPHQVLNQENLAKAFGSSLLVIQNGAMLVDECGEQWPAGPGKGLSRAAGKLGNSRRVGIVRHPRHRPKRKVIVKSETCANSCP